MLRLTAVPRVLARPNTLIAAVVALLAAGLMVGLSPSQADSAPAQPPQAEAKERKATPGFQIASLNLEKGMSASAMRQDFRTLIRNTNTSVIGLQERLGSFGATRKALPKHWRLLMPRGGPTGADDNPIAFNMRVWKLENTWTKKLAGQAWRRDSGKVAHQQFGVVGVLKHRRTKHVIRAVSFHLPPGIHDRASGGPAWSARDRVEAAWDMAATVRQLKRRAPKKQQFVVACDCNVTESRDTGKQLVKGKITRPLRLENNYTVGGYRPGWRIDYVMAERRSDFRMKGWRSFRNLRTDHPGIVARFKHR